MAQFEAAGAPPRTDDFLARHHAILLYAQLAVLGGLTFGLGRAGIGAVRYAFIAGCIVIGYQAWRQGPARHLEISIVLFVWAPFLRRVVDFSAGFDPSGYMLIGPILALLPPCADLYAWLVTGSLKHSTRALWPYVLMGLCLLYGLCLSIANGDMLPAALGLAKFVPTMLYGLWLAARGGEEPNVIEGATRGFLIAMPAAGLYGIYQYFYLPDWDSFWMTMTASINDAQGVAEAEKVRVFGPMNSAESLGHFCTAAILLIGFSRRAWLALLLCLPIVTSLLLSSYRTAWIGLAVGILYCGLQGGTRRRAAVIAIWIVAGAAVILATTSFGDKVMDRIASFEAPSSDGSGQARWDEYVAIAHNPEQDLVGLGIGGLGPFGDLQPRQTIIVDGIVIDAIMLMGLVGGSLYLLALLWASMQGLAATFRSFDPRAVAAAAIIIANLAAIPLASITRGEVGFLFWAFVGAATATAGGAARSAGLAVHVSSPLALST
jgi:hypothetical protein